MKTIHHVKKQGSQIVSVSPLRYESCFILASCLVINQLPVITARSVSASPIPKDSPTCTDPADPDLGVS